MHFDSRPLNMFAAAPEPLKNGLARDSFGRAPPADAPYSRIRMSVSSDFCPGEPTSCWAEYRLESPFIRLNRLNP